ncbi:hypothetical protein [Paenibacillus motobuensis]|uniref:BIG2 domain-containing protein n=1 Tax=Paenibacillus motobuensis TaxID=295324 RepID=A0ABN0YQ43_9BACL
MYFLRKITAALLAMLVSIASLAGIASAADAKKVSVDVATNYTTLVPGQSVLVSVKISNIPSDLSGLRSAKVVLSYDENVFTTEGNIRFDEDLGKYIWRDDTFFIPSQTFETPNYRIENPYPEDSNPADGRQEVVLSISALNNKTINQATDEAFASFFLTVKQEVKTQDTSIHIVSEGTMLEDAAGKPVHSYGTISAHLLVGAPQKIEIVRGTLPPASDPIKLSINSGMELNALAVFDNGDTAYVTELTSWETTDPQVIQARAQGNIKAIGLGKASVTATLGSVTGKHEVAVYPANAPELIEEEVIRVIITRIPNERSFAAATAVQIKVNGKTAEPGRLFDGTVYVPLRSVSKLLGVDVGYDSAQKAPTINGKTVTHFYTFSGVSYIMARDLSPLLGAEVKWDKSTTTLTIKASASRK